MSVAQDLQYIEALNTLYINKVITREEFREQLQTTPLFHKVCQKPSAPKDNRRRS